MIFFLFLLGLILGSFANALIWRLNNENAPKFWQGRSICPTCRHQLGWKDNVPLLSFILLKARCRYCKAKISWQYPIVELTTAIIFTLTGLHPVILALELVFVVIFFSDLIYGLVPDEMILLGCVFFVFNFSVVNLIVGIITAAPFLLFAKLKWMGYGDVTLSFLMGIILGFPRILVAMWSGFIFGGFTAMVLLLLRKTKISATIPLGPFLIIGLVVSALWSKDLLNLLGLSQLLN